MIEDIAKELEQHFTIRLERATRDAKRMMKKRGVKDHVTSVFLVSALDEAKKRVNLDLIKWGIDSEIMNRK